MVHVLFRLGLVLLTLDLFVLPLITKNPGLVVVDVTGLIVSAILVLVSLLSIRIDKKG